MFIKENIIITSSSFNDKGVLVKFNYENSDYQVTENVEYEEIKLVMDLSFSVDTMINNRFVYSNSKSFKNLAHRGHSVNDYILMMDLNKNIFFNEEVENILAGLL
jgi:hypothetical protein